MLISFKAILLGAIGLGTVVLLLWRMRSRTRVRVDEGVLRMGDLVAVPESASRLRAELLPAPSEDARHLLVLPELTPPEETSYGPDARTEWVVDVQLPPDATVTRGEVDAAFGPVFLRNVRGATVYGVPAGTDEWTYVHAAGSPNAWSQLAVGFALVDWTADAPAAVSEAELEKAFATATKCGARLDLGQLSPREPASEAAARSARFGELRHVSDTHVHVALVAPGRTRFDGRAVWDVMLGLGLAWGDMDCFHWRNPEDVGDDMFFSVETTTPPGYFLPERIADGQVHVDDLVFTFSIARSAAPQHVLEQMLRAIRYAQTRLGGSIHDADGRPLDERAAIAEVDDIVATLRNAGIEPGSDLALRLF